MPYEQNNINAPTCKGTAAAKNRIYDGCVDTLFGGDAAFDSPLDLIPTPGELLYYISHGIGCGNRCLWCANGATSRKTGGLRRRKYKRGVIAPLLFCVRHYGERVAERLQNFEKSVYLRRCLHALQAGYGGLF